MADEATRKYLDPVELSKISGLEIRARLIVEGFISGLHKSPYRGASVEFAEHREYVPGDDIRHIDWKVYARSDRYYIKQYEEETNLTATILVDGSESMKFRSSDELPSKLDYACYVAASLAYLILRRPLREELASSVAAIECGSSRAVALRSLAARSRGTTLAALAGALERARRHCSPLSRTLH